MKAILASFSLVALSEMGDKTQLLAFSLAARFRKPWIVLAGILVATVLNHLMAAYLGEWGASWLTPRILGLVLGVSFIGFGFWTLKPDTLDEEEKWSHQSPFLTTAVLFFLAEMGDKTQFATIALAARFHSILAVTLGTTAGMMVADGLAVFLGEALSHRVSMKGVRILSALVFFGFGIAALVSVF